MPRVLDKIEPRTSEPVLEYTESIGHEIEDLPIADSLAWILDPFAPVPPNWEELVNPMEPKGTEEKSVEEKDYDTSVLEDLFNDLDDDQLYTLAGLLLKLDPVEIKDGSARYTPDEIDLIGKLKDGIEGAELEDEVTDEDADEDEEQAEASGLTVETLDSDPHKVVELPTEDEDPAEAQEKAVEANVSAVTSS